MSQFEFIDATLAEWAKVNSLTWFAEYQDTEVRTFLLNPESKARVQVAVDVPHNEQTIVRVGQNRKGLSRLSRVANYPTSLSELAQTLDTALQTANQWATEDDRSLS